MSPRGPTGHGPSTSKEQHHPPKSPYDRLDVDPYGRVHARVDSDAFRQHLPEDVLRDDRLPIDPDDYNNGDRLTVRIGVSTEVPGRIVLDVDRGQLSSPTDR